LLSEASPHPGAREPLDGAGRSHPPEAHRRADHAEGAAGGEQRGRLMEALRRSVGKEAASAKADKPAKKSRKAASGQKEMLMPTAGKKPVKETTANKPAARQQRKSA